MLQNALYVRILFVFLFAFGFMTWSSPKWRKKNAFLLAFKVFDREKDCKSVIWMALSMQFQYSKTIWKITIYWFKSVIFFVFAENSSAIISLPIILCNSSSFLLNSSSSPTYDSYSLIREWRKNSWLQK